MLRALFKSMFRLMVFLYRATKGGFGGQVQGLNVLLLTSTGRKSGKQHTTPLGYFEEDGSYVVCASNAGFGCAIPFSSARRLRGAPAWRRNTPRARTPAST